MKLPYAEHVRVDREKVTDYLLSPSHPDGASKANFFTRYGDLEAPDGRRPLVRTVWILAKGSAEPRLVTAYPA